MAKNVMLISDDICQHMDGYVDIMANAETDMKAIEQAANLTDEAIHNLETSIMEISGFTNEITEITEQTNLLALNASIEAARAGEQVPKEVQSVNWTFYYLAQGCLSASLNEKSSL